MTHFVGLDVAKATTSVCIMDRDGQVVREGVVETAPAAIVAYLRADRRRYKRVGLETINFASWLYEGLAKAGLPVICIEARHAHSVLRARLNKTDRNDARGIAELMRLGVYKAVHVKTKASQEAKLLLTIRRTLQRKQTDLDNLIRGTLLQYGQKLPQARGKAFVAKSAALADCNVLLKRLIASLLEARTILAEKVKCMDAEINEIVRRDQPCQHFLTAPGVGPITALSFRCAIDVPQRFARSRSVGVHLGLTPRSFQSGTMFRRGRISKCGDRAARAALFLSAQAVIRKAAKPNELKAWGDELRKTKRYNVTLVAVARRLAIILHRMWLKDLDFDQLCGETRELRLPIGVDVS